MPNNPPQIIAMGGGSFVMEPDNPALDLYILRQAKTKKPAVGFVGTASGDSDRYLVMFYSAFNRFDCRPSHLPLFGRTLDLRNYFLSQDVIYVGGGNTKSMLAVWADWGLPELLREAWQSGVVLAGVSAGAICWFEQGVTDSYAGDLRVLNCLGFLSGSCCPHYDGEAERRPALHKFLQRDEILPGYALDDGAALHYHNREIHRIVSSRPEARAYRLRVENSVITEETLSIELLEQS